MTGIIGGAGLKKIMMMNFKKPGKELKIKPPESFKTQGVILNYGIKILFY